MLLMVTGTYPVTSAADFGKLAIDEMKNNPYPDFIKRNYYFKFGGDGVIAYIIYDIEEGNEEAARKDISSRMFKMMHSVKGLTASLEPLFSVEEGFSWLSMVAPTV